MKPLKPLKWVNIFVVVEMCVGLRARAARSPNRTRTVRTFTTLAAARTVRTFTTLAAARAAAAPGAAIAKYRIQVPATWAHRNSPTDREPVSALRGGKLVTA